MSVAAKAAMRTVAGSIARRGSPPASLTSWRIARCGYRSSRCCVCC
ncbi:hypothetical protein [Lysobacter gummosus]